MSEASRSKRFVLIDGKSVFYRGYYAMPNLATKDGTPTGGVFGFSVMALEVIKQLKPDYVAVAWDKPKTNIRARLKLYPEYKANRKPAPPDFYAQIPILHKLLDTLGWPLYELDDYEADDIIGTLASQATKKGIETLIVTSDLDVLQLIDSKVHAYMLKTGLSNIELFSLKSFEAKYGLVPEQFLDLKALSGDSSDNIPGVPGIGAKTATDLLKTYKTLDEVYENIDLVKETVRKKLVAGKELAYLSKKLGQIWTDAPVKLNLVEVDGSKIKPEQLAKILTELEFRSLLVRLPQIMNISPESLSKGSDSPKLASGKNEIIRTDAELQDVTLSGLDSVVVYSRAKGKHGKDPIILVLSPTPEKVYSLILDKLDPKKVADKLKSLAGSDGANLVGYDTKSAIEVGYNLGVELSNIGHDVLIASFLLNPLRRDLSLSELAQNDLGYEHADFEDLDNEQVVEKASEIVAVIRQIEKKQKKELAEIPKLAKIAKDIEWPIIPILAKMEHLGIKLDKSVLAKISDSMVDLISDCEQKIYGHANREFNISSPAQLSEVLFNELKLPTAGVKRGKSAYSTGMRELDKLRELHPIIDLITEYRELTKLKNTYVDVLPQLVDENSRVHTTFNLTISQTGRLSSTDPNLQNIPIRTELGRKIRSAFVAGPGKVFISADYSQFELRLAAYFANDKQLIEEFNNDTDIHTLIAAQVYGRNPEDVTKQMRRFAKVINFGILYGMSPHGLSQATGMNQAAAKSFIDKYYEVRAPLINYMNSLREKARKVGYAEDLFGRRRPMPDINSPNFVIRQAAERAAINMPIQGTEADLMKMAMIDIDKKLKDSGADILLQIHDSVLVECPENKAEEIAQMLKDTMEKVYKLPVKLTVDTSIAKDWGALG
ncbi:MAG TPA: DNA polymerase I [Candidatus Saccharimonadales bacterium]|nr:DNA polymerase I [Candidatus Saccharimonadales bacterium]